MVGLGTWYMVEEVAARYSSLHLLDPTGDEFA